MVDRDGSTGARVLVRFWTAASANEGGEAQVWRSGRVNYAVFRARVFPVFQVRSIQTQVFRVRIRQLQMFRAQLLLLLPMFRAPEFSTATSSTQNRRNLHNPGNSCNQYNP